MEKGYGKNFWITCWSMFLFMTSFNLMIPELNDFLSNLGGSTLKGLNFTMFTLASALARPFSGRLSDVIGRKPVMYIGILVCVITSVLYPISSTVFFFLGLRFFHGFSAGFFPTGSTALLTDYLPANKRGIGMGIWGTFTSLGIGVGQGLGSPLTEAIGLTNMFYISSILAIISLLLAYSIEESLPHKQPFKFKHLLLPKTDIVEWKVLPSAIVMFLTSFCSGIIFVLTPDLSKFVGSTNKGSFFIYYVICTIAVRIFFGSLSDKIGREKTMAIGVTILIISMFIIGYANNQFIYSIGSIIFGFATGISSPTLFAWTADLSPAHRRGIGSGTMFVALELGIMTGSLVTLITYDSTIHTVLPTFLIGCFSAFIAWVYLIVRLIKMKRTQHN